MEKATKINVILVSVILVLLTAFCMSFDGRKSGRDKREVLKTSLVNPKYKDGIMRIELSRNADFLALQKENGIWFCECEGNEGSFNFVPAENKKVGAFIEALAEVRNLPKISCRESDLPSFGFNADDQFTVLYQTNDGDFYDIKFGNHDFSLSNRYVMGGKKQDLYEVDASFEKYLYTALNQWSDPYILSRNINGEYKFSDVQRVLKKSGGRTERIMLSKTVFEDWQKPSSETTDFSSYVSTLLELRHGGIPQSQNQESLNQSGKADLELTIEFGDTAEYRLEFFPNEENGKITVRCRYDFPPESKRPTVFYTVEISQWTYEKLK